MKHGGIIPIKSNVIQGNFRSIGNLLLKPCTGQEEVIKRKRSQN